jgi:hypothetical protein
MRKFGMQAVVMHGKKILREGLCVYKWGTLWGTLQE